MKEPQKGPAVPQDWRPRGMTLNQAIAELRKAGFKMTPRNRAQYHDIVKEHNRRQQQRREYQEG